MITTEKELTYSAEKNNITPDTPTYNKSLKERLEIVKKIDFKRENRNNSLNQKVYTETVSGLLNIKTLRTAVKTDKPLMYLYDNGFFKQGAETYIKELNYQKYPSFMRRKLNDELIHRIQAQTYVDADYFENFNPAYLNVKNGVINLLTGEFFQHNPEYKMTTILPVEYHPDSDSSFMFDFVSQIVEGDDNKVIQEMFGYCLYRITLFQLAFMLLGSGANGKSVLLYCLSKLFGDNNISAVNLQDLVSDRFATAQLYRKYANIVSETPRKNLAATEIFKTLTDGSLITAQYKFGQPFTYRNYAKLIFAANTLPQTFDNSYAFWRRWILVNFPNTFTGANDDKNLKEKLTTPEKLPGILNYALEGFRRLYKQQQVSTGKTAKDIEEEWTRNSNSPLAFITTCLKENDEGEIRTNKMLSSYYAFCKKYEMCPENEITFWKSFNKNIKGIYPNVEKKQYSASKKYYWKGIKLIE